MEYPIDPVSVRASSAHDVHGKGCDGSTRGDQCPRIHTRAVRAPGGEKRKRGDPSDGPHFKYDSCMGDAQRLTPDEQVRFAFAAYESGRDFTVAVEEGATMIRLGTVLFGERNQ